MAIPHLFRCPISLDLFTDPVTLCTGQTYDRSSIEKWLATGNLTCPVTMQKLQDPSMVPNHTLRHLIDQWIQNGHHLDPDYFTKIAPHDPSLAAIRHNLESHEVSLQFKLQLLENIQDLSQELPNKNYCLIELEFFSLLLELVFDQDQYPQENMKFVEKSLVCALKLMPFSDLSLLNMLKEESKLAQFVLLFEQDNIIIKKSLCHLVEAISSSFLTQDLCLVLGTNPRLFQEIIHLLLDTNSNLSEAAIKSISALCSFESNQENLVQEGAIQGLITHIVEGEKSLAPMAISTLEKLLRLENGKLALTHHSDGVLALVKMVFRVSDHEGSESALNCLMIICHESLSAREEAIGAGVLTQLLLLLQSQCSERTKTKARMLLKLLRSMWIKDPKKA